MAFSAPAWPDWVLLMLRNIGRMVNRGELMEKASAAALIAGLATAYART